MGAPAWSERKKMCKCLVRENAQNNWKFFQDASLSTIIARETTSKGIRTALIVAVRADVEIIVQLAARVVTMCISQCVQLQIAAGLQRRRVTVQAAATRPGRVIFSFSCGRGKDAIQRGRVGATVSGQVRQGVRGGAGERHHPDVDAVER